MADPAASMRASQAAPPRPRVGVSSCLLGEPVRFDGNHKRNAYVCEVLGHWFEWVPHCPETAIGLGTPRPPIHLRRIHGETRAVSVRGDGLDATAPLRADGERFAAAHRDLDGYILKKDSPSCGLARVRLYDASGTRASREGQGIFAQTLQAHFPDLPLEEEGRLADPRLAENFIMRVFVHYRWRRLWEKGLTPARLIAFHTAHKLLLLAHSPAAYARLGRRLASAGRETPRALASAYFGELMQALSRPADPGRQVNVLQHIAGYFSRDLDAGDRAELAASIHDYGAGLAPLAVPLALIRHHLRRHPKPYLHGQVYLDPYPRELERRCG